MKKPLRIARTWISLSLITTLIFPMLSCYPKADVISTSIPDGDVMSTSILGGEVKSTDRKAKVLIPPRALAEGKDITIRSATAPVLSGGLSVVGDTYEFGPANITFNYPVTIALAYENGYLPEGVAPEDLLLVSITNDGNFTALNNIRVNTEAGTVSGDISHFSLIALTHVATESSLKVTPEKLDFDNVLVSTTSTETLIINNPTASDIQITSLEIAPFADNWDNTLAGLVPAFSVAPTSVTPFTVSARGERQIQVNFHPISTGVYRGDLLVSTRDATTKIRLAGTGVLSLGGLSIVPEFHDFGPVKLLPLPASTENAGFSLVNHSSLPIQIHSAQVSAFTFSTGIFSLVGVSPAGSTLNSRAVTPVHVSYTPETTNTEFGYILILGTDSAGNPAGAVSLLQGYGVIDGVVNGKLHINIDPLDFGEVLVGTRATLNSRVSNTGTTHFDATGYVTNSWFFLPTIALRPLGPLAPGNAVQAPITFCPQKRKPYLGCWVEADGTNGNNIVNCFATLKGTGVDAELTFVPDPCDFGDVCVGNSKQIKITVTNSGDFDVDVAGYEWPNAPFEVVSTVPRTLTLAKGQSYEYNIEFTPTDVDLFNDSLVITVEFEHRGQKHTREFKLTVSGTGVACVQQVSALSIEGSPSCSPIAVGSQLDFQVLVRDLTNGKAPIVAVLLYIDGEKAYSSGAISAIQFPPPPGIIFRRITSPGPHTIRVLAVNAQGQEHEQTWNVYCGEEPVEQPPPVYQPPAEEPIDQPPPVYQPPAPVSICPKCGIPSDLCPCPK